MKVLMINGSSHPRGCTYTALSEVGAALSEEGIDFEIVNVGNQPLRDCIACGKCDGKKCIFEGDGVNEFVEKAYEADGFVFGSPVYYAHPSGRLLSFLDRAFMSSWDGVLYKPFAYKPAAAVVSARRGGTTAALDVIEKYFGIANMFTVGSTYWNMVHGSTPADVRIDEEGVQTMHNIGFNMAWFLENRSAGQAAALPGAPKLERDKVTSFHH